MALIYRIEDENGDGPYRGVVVRWGDDGPMDYSRHPTPHEDSGIRPAWEEMEEYERELFSFGFRNEAQMRAWFYADEWLQAMADAGYKLTVWEVKIRHCHYGHAQAIFRKDKAKLVETRELI